MAQLPPELQAEKQAAVTASLNRHLQAQSEFYRAREQWMDAAEGICRLIDSRRASCTFSEAGVDFAADEDLRRFEKLLAEIEAAHQAEVAGVQQRILTLTSSLGVLGPTGG